MSQNNSDLTTVQFHDQTLLATLVDGVPYVALNPICENIGLAWNGQLERIKRHSVLNSTMRVIRMVAADGKNREVAVLPLSKLNGWLFGVDVERVKPEIKDLVIAYQEECFDVLANHFMPKPNGLKSSSKTTVDLEEYKRRYKELKALKVTIAFDGDVILEMLEAETKESYQAALQSFGCAISGKEFATTDATCLKQMLEQMIKEKTPVQH